MSRGGSRDWDRLCMDACSDDAPTAGEAFLIVKEALNECLPGPFDSSIQRFAETHEYSADEHLRIVGAHRILNRVIGRSNKFSENLPAPTQEERRSAFGTLRSFCTDDWEQRSGSTFQANIEELIAKATEGGAWPDRLGLYNGKVKWAIDQSRQEVKALFAVAGFKVDAEGHWAPSLSAFACQSNMSASEFVFHEKANAHRQKSKRGEEFAAVEARALVSAFAILAMRLRAAGRRHAEECHASFKTSDPLPPQREPSPPLDKAPLRLREFELPAMDVFFARREAAGENDLSGGVLRLYLSGGENTLRVDYVDDSSLRIFRSRLVLFVSRAGEIESLSSPFLTESRARTPDAGDKIASCPHCKARTLLPRSCEKEHMLARCPHCDKWIVVTDVNSSQVTIGGVVAGGPDVPWPPILAGAMEEQRDVQRLFDFDAFSGSGPRCPWCGEALPCLVLVQFPSHDRKCPFCAEWVRLKRCGVRSCRAVRIFPRH